MSAASFDRGTLVEAGVALGDPVASGVAETATAVRAGVAEGVDRSVRARSADGCGLARYPARAIPAASATTTANGPRVNKAPLRISHIFIGVDRLTGIKRHAKTYAETHPRLTTDPARPDAGGPQHTRR